MREALKRIITTCILACVSILYADAQSHSLGTTYSFGGIGIEYEHDLNPDCFINAGIRAETANHFMDSKREVGVSASLSCNFIIKQWSSRNGNTVSAFAGPGATFGKSHDFNKDSGYFFGLKGRAGIECRFGRNISISLSFNPILGSHMVIFDEHIEMNPYKLGLINAVLPEIGINYMF